MVTDTAMDMATATTPRNSSDVWHILKEKSILESGLLDGFTDHHSNLLPGVDDGFQTADLTLEALRTMEQAGVADVWLTPHIMEDVPNTVARSSNASRNFPPHTTDLSACISQPRT